jgi:hypothetical protein
MKVWDTHCEKVFLFDVRIFEEQSDEESDKTTRQERRETVFPALQALQESKGMFCLIVREEHKRIRERHTIRSRIRRKDWMLHTRQEGRKKKMSKEKE